MNRVARFPTIRRFSDSPAKVSPDELQDAAADDGLRQRRRRPQPPRAQGRRAHVQEGGRPQAGQAHVAALEGEDMITY